MNKDFFDKLLNYYDNQFTIEKVEIDSYGSMGMHYYGLNFDEYLEDSIMSIDYLDIEDYFSKEANANYVDDQSLVYQYSQKSSDEKLKIMEAILSLIVHSNYKKDLTNKIYDKTNNYLKRANLELRNDNDYIKIINNKKVNEDSYSEIYEYNALFYKKKIKSIYSNNKQWIKRLKYEYENMEKLSDSPYILNVLNYDANENSYLMEKCDCCIEDYIKNNPTLSNNEILELIKQIIYGMKDAHNKGIIHRDLHLGNILIKDHQVVLCDFGLSKDTMIKHSLLSSVTPKNSHYFIAPEGFKDFTLLDKTSDIYSIGKIIEYLTQNSSLNNSLSYVINKAISREKKDRYQDLNEMLNDIAIAFNDIEEKEKIKTIENDIKKSNLTPLVQEYVNSLLSNEQLANYIVEKQLYSFCELLLKFSTSIQEKILIHINNSYSNATGYGQWHNYDLFASIAYNYIQNSTELKLQKISFSILEDCANIRYNANNLFETIKLKYPYLK